MSGSMFQDAAGRSVQMCPAHDDADSAADAIRAMSVNPDAEGYPFGRVRCTAAIIGRPRCDHPSHRESLK